MDRWERTDEDKEGSWDDGARSRPGAPPRRTTGRSKPLPPQVAAEIRRALEGSTAHHKEVMVDKMQDAVAAYDRGRYPEAAKLGKQVANEAPMVPAVREVVGLAAYRAGRWREAIRQLDAYGALTDEVDHIPALMDSHRALGKPRKVATLWTELRQRSPEPEVLAEARMVAAGSLADRGDLDGAISLLAGAGAAKALRNPADRHLRQWYALGDLYERAGDLPRAREFFVRVLNADPDAYDVADRLQSLGPERPRRNRKRPTTARSLKNPPAGPAAP
ncbi:MAG: tetratricopeptide repeat protein [Acidimicrobiales bacterium]